MEKESEDSTDVKTPEESAKEILEKAELEKAEHGKLLGLTPEEYIQMIRETRNEAKDRRLKLKELTEKLSAYEKRETEEREKKLKESGELQTLLDEKDKLINEYKPKVEEFEKYIDKKKRAVKSELEAAGVWSESLSKLSLIDLENIAEKFKTKTPTDNSKGFKNNNGYEKTPEEKMAGIYKQ